MFQHKENKCLVVLLLGLLFVTLVNGECNTCASHTNIACVSNSSFQFCSNDLPVGTIYSCPANQDCVVTGGCQVNADPALIACQECELCDATQTFGCLTMTTFALCLGTNDLSPITGTCNGELICNMDNEFICGSPSDGWIPTCPTASVEETTSSTSTTTSTTSTTSTTTSTTTTTPSPVDDPNGFCETIGQEGRFPVGTDPSTTCKQYVRCIQTSNGWSSATYLCPGGTYFNSATGACSSRLPPTCTGSVRSLMLYDLQLN